MQRQLTSLDHLIWQAGCPDFKTPLVPMAAMAELGEATVGGKTGPDAHLDELGEMLADRVSSRSISPTCAVLMMQVALLQVRDDCGAMAILQQW